MKRMVKNLLSVTLLVGSAAFAADATTAVTPYFSARSQSQDLARLQSGTVGHIYKADMDKHYGNFAVTPEYTRSFDGDKISQSLFGCYYLQNCNKLIITGSGVANRPLTDLLADWFYLPSDYQGSICFEPVVQNFNADLDLFWGMDEWAQGLFFRIHAPITWTKWDLGASFKTTVTGTNGTTTVLDNAEKFFCKKQVSTDADVTYAPLTCARFCGCLGCDNMSKTRLADIQADLGWNFLLNEDYHLGLFARAVAPTGNKVKGEWLFEPIVGNGRHWELGGGLTSSVIMWRNKEEDKHFGFYVDANVTHLFNAKQNRVFDLVDRPLSRYISAIKVVGGVTTSAPLANLTSCEMKVNVAVQTDVTAMFNYTSKNWSYDLGYNFWYKSCEKFDCDLCNTCTPCCNDSCNACDCCGACIIKNGNTDDWSVTSATANINAQTAGVDVILTDSMIDYNGARTKGMSNKVFGHVAYSWNDCEVVPFLGLGGSAEFGRNENCCNTDCNNNCNSCSTDCCTTNSCNNNCCKNVALSQWGIWLKGGCSF